MRTDTSFCIFGVVFLFVGLVVYPLFWLGLGLFICGVVLRSRTLDRLLTKFDEGDTK